MKRKKIIIGIIIILLLIVFLTFYLIFKQNNNQNNKTRNFITERHVVGGKKINIYYKKENTSISPNIYLGSILLDGDYNMLKIENTMNDISNKSWKEYKNNIIKDKSNTSMHAYFKFSTAYINNKIISFNQNIDILTDEVAVDKLLGYNFNIKNNELLTIKDIINNYDIFKDFILKEIYNRLGEYEKNGGCVNELGHKDEDSDKYITTIINNDNIWYYSEKGISFSFSDYAFICDSTGIFTVEIPKEQINRYLKDEYKI